MRYEKRAYAHVFRVQIFNAYASRARDSGTFPAMSGSSPVVGAVQAWCAPPSLPIALHGFE